MYKMLIVLIAFGLFGAMPVLADEDCNMIILDKEGTIQCELKDTSAQPKIERIEDVKNHDLNKYREQEQEKIEVIAKEDNDMLKELIK